MKKRFYMFPFMGLMIIWILALTVSAVDHPNSGTCGPEAVWTMEDDTLTISGRGIIKEHPWTAGERYEWFQWDIREVVIEEGITGIGYMTFREFEKLETVQIPDTVTFIGAYAFSDCKNLKHISLPAGLSTIESYAFANCTGLKEVTIPEGIGSIAEGLFFGCSGIKSLKLPESVTILYKCAFQNCSALEEVTLPEGLVSIQDQAFYGCSSLKQITLPEQIFFIGKSCFANCSALEHIFFRRDITYVGEAAFEGCSSLREIDLGEGLERINKSVFNGCTGLERIELPSTVTYIDEAAFRGCSALREIVLPEKLETIMYYAFEKCTSLESVIIPKGVTNIIWGAFKDSGLKDITILSKTLQIGDNAFPAGIVVHGYAGSGAEVYAKDERFDATFIPLEATAEMQFTDVQDDDYFAVPVLWAVEHQVTTGTSDTTFSPDMPCTRGQVVTFLWRYMGAPEPVSDSCKFIDITPGTYYYKAVLWAYENQITSGVEWNLFAPDQVVTRAEFVTFLDRAVTYNGLTNGKDFPFVDVEQGTYYYLPVLHAFAYNITSGVDEIHFDPFRICTRGQVVTFIYRAASLTPWLKP